MNYLQRAKKILLRIDELAAISEDEGFIARTYGTPAFLEARNKVEQWMKEAGLSTRVDNIGNIRGKLLSNDPNAKTFVIASHIDTVINAGKFDGPLGVIAGLDILERLVQSKTTLPFHIELIGFCDEEGCRFHTTYLGSKAVAGCFDNHLLQIKDEAGQQLADVIEANGGNVNELANDVIPKEQWLGYYEIHIEQGPVLYEKNIPVAVVTGIAGQYRAGIIFNGENGHAGTVPMTLRKDGLACAAEFVLAVESFAKQYANLVATVGKLHIIHPASNVIPGEVIVSLDLRSDNEELLVSSYAAIQKLAEEICQKRNCVLEWNLIQYNKPVICDTSMSRMLAQSINKSGQELVTLVSGAGHDAVTISTVAPVSMLFVKCFKGISHNPLENVEPEDIAAAIEVSDNFIQQLIRSNNL
ncbi:M20 family metallo-hydrolase [Terrimonas alba]|uniref:M20 family metallo-hydrolase n=1 Tax=Terrimonas alba TaxID=3349636 RepID=UPI0035F49B5F